MRRRLLLESLEGRRLLASVTIPSNVAANPGDSVVMPLTIDDAAGVQAFDFTIVYDTVKLDAANVDVALGGLTSSDWSIAKNVNDAAGQITVSMFATSPLASGSGELATITFHVASGVSGTATLDLEGSLNEGNVPLTPIDGSIQIGGSTNNDPTAVNDSATVTEGTSGNVIDVLANDTSAPDVGETLTVVSVGAPSQGGAAAVAPDGLSVLYTPVAGFVGSESFSYTISDGNGGTATAQVDMTVAALAPVSIVRTGDTYTTIGQAVAAAINGDTILVGDGVYQESVTVDKSLTIRAANVGGAIVDGGGSTVKSVFHATASSTFIGLHLTNAENGIYMHDSNIHVRAEYVVASNMAGPAFGINNGASQVGTMEIINATVVDSGAAAQINDGGTITVRNALLDNVSAAFILHNGVAIVGDHVLLNNVSVVAAGTDTSRITVNPAPIVADPLFVDRAAKNFRLQSGSPAIDAGRDMGLGHLGAAPELGAHEFNPVGQLSGEVWRDDDRDGVRESGEPELAGVSIALLDAAGVQIAVTQTDAAGRYEFANLTPADYRVRFHDPAGTNFSPQDQGADDSLDSDADPNDGVTGLVAVLSGATTEDVDAGLYATMVTVGLRAVASTDGRALDAVPLGGDFLLQVTLADNRTNATGVFQAGLDVTYPASRTSLDGPISFASDYPHDRGGDTATAGLIDEARAHAGTSPLSAGTHVLLSAPMSADAAGQATFVAESADDLPAHGIYLFDSLLAVPIADIDFRSLDLEIINGAAPVASGDAYTVDEDGTLTVNAAGGVLANDSDADGDAISGSLVSGPTHGTLTFNADGSFTYEPDADFHGSDSFTYRISDGRLTSEAATVAISVSPINDSPTADDDAYTVRRNGTLTIAAADGVLANDGDVDGDSLAAALVTPPQHGTVHLAADGSFVYTPAANYVGPDSFSYEATDGNGGSATATVSIDVLLPTVVFSFAAEDADGDPITQVARGDTFELLVFVQDLRTNADGVHAGYLDVLYDYTRIKPDGPITFGPEYQNGTSGDMSLDGLFDEAGVFDSFGPLDGAPHLLMRVPMRALAFGAADVSGEAADWSPAHDVLLFGSDDPVPLEEIEYGTLQIDVVSPSHSNDDTFTVPEDSRDEPLDVLQNDVANTAGGLTIIGVGPRDRGGSVRIAAGGQSLLYTPAADFHGVETFVYRVRDGQGNEHESVVTVNVAPVNDPPTANDDRFTHEHGTSAALDVLENDTAAPDRNETLTIVVVSSPDHGGQATIAPDGLSIEYSPAVGFVGTESFTYTIDDGNGAAATATVTIDVAYGGWQNARNRLDVNDDGQISPIDALLVVNAINIGGARRLSPPTAPAPLPPPFIDVSGDGFLSPVDALLVINDLNRRAAGASEGMPNAGDSPIASASPAGSSVSAPSPTPFPQPLAGAFDASRATTNHPARSANESQGSLASELEDELAHVVATTRNTNSVHRENLKRRVDRDRDVDVAVAELAGEFDSDLEATLASLFGE